MSAPRWAVALLERLAPRGGADDVVGDLEEVHRARVERRGRWLAALLTGLDTLVMATALLRSRTVRSRSRSRNGESPRGLPFFSGLTVSGLDFKLGFRMLLRYPGLTAVGGLAIAFAICAGAATFEFARQVLNPTLPLDEGERIVGVVLRDRETANVERRALFDFERWRKALRSIDELGAYRSSEHNLILEDGIGHPVETAEISAAGFRVARVPPLLGRTLEDVDERPEAPAVAVVGHDLWQRLLHGDPDVIGKTVRVGNTETTIVGVMPAAFEFPVSHELWTPLHVEAAGYAPRSGPGISVFGRLAKGVSLAEAQAELTSLGLQAATDAPDTHSLLAPTVMPFARAVLGISGEESLVFASIQAFVLLLVVLVCANVALLMFARAVTRETEIVVRSALGASRRRIVGQLLAEALVLGSVGALVGVGVSRLGLRWWLHAFEQVGGVTGGDLPFWIRDTIAPSTVAYAAGLTVLGAAITGILPGLKATRGLQTRLQQTSPGSGRAPFGGLWTAVIVTQVAVTVTVPAFAFFVQRDVAQIESAALDLAEDEYVAVGLQLQRDPQWSQQAFLQRFRSTVDELAGRLSEEPAVLAATTADRLPRMYHPHRLIEVDEGGAAPLDPGSRLGNCAGSCRGYRVSTATVDPDYFAVLEAPILAGRGFASGDSLAEPAVAIVNESFIERVLGGRSALGRRLRYTYFEEWGRGRPAGEFAETEPGPWLEIVGVVPDLGMATEPDPKVAGIYLPMPPDGLYPVHLAVHVRGDPHALEPSLRALATRVDPNLRLGAIQTIGEIDDASLEFYRFWFWVIVLVSSIAMLLSLLGIYSVMSFTGSRRTREIGIRVALGSGRGRIAAAIFRRPLLQVGGGVVGGALLTGALAYGILGDSLWPGGALLVSAYALLMLGVCLLACIVPTRRALRVQPTEALRTDG